VHRPGTPDRRSLLLGAAVAAGLAGAGCGGGGRRLGEPAGSRTPGSKTASRSAVPAGVDRKLRATAVAQQKQLLAAAAARSGEEPYATVRTLHLEHLRRLTSSAATPPSATAHDPVAADLAAAEHQAAAELRADCLRASPELAPLLASLAASSEVAAFLLTP
jgi:hypothetical protein